MIIKRIKRIAYKPNEGFLYYKWIVADPSEELKIFINDNGYCVRRAVRSTTGKIEKYQRVSKYFDSLEQVQKFRNHLIDCNDGRYDYVIIDFLYCDDVYIDGYTLLDEQIEDVIKEDGLK